MMINIAICSYFQKELEYIIKEMDNTEIESRVFPPICTSSRRLNHDYFRKNSPAFGQYEILGSEGCLHCDHDIDDHINLNIEKVCFNWLMNNQLIEERSKESFIVTPGWLLDWENIVFKKWGFDHNTGKQFFKDMNKPVLLLDTGVYDQVDLYAQSFSNFIDQDIETCPIGTDYLKLKLQSIISDHQKNQNQLEIKKVNTENKSTIAEYTMIFDLLSKLSTGISQHHLMKKLVDIIITLVAPKKVILAIFHSGKLIEKACKYDVDELPSDFIEFCINSDVEFKLLENDKGFMLKSIEDNEYINCILVDDFMFPDYQEKYMIILQNIIGMFTVIISRARSHANYLKALEEVSLKEVYFRQLFEGSPEPILTLDKHLIPTSCNPAFIETFGYSFEEISVIKNRNKFLNITKLEDYQKIKTNLLTQNYILEETTRVTKHNQVLDIEILIYPIINLNNNLGYYVIYTDITERKKATNQLIEKNRELKKVIQDLKLTQVKLIESEKAAALSTTIAGLAHELNTPIGTSVTILSFLEQQTRIFEKKYHNSELTKSNLDSFIQNVNETVATLDTNLDVAKKYIADFKLVAVDQSSKRIRTFDLKSYIHSILGSMRPVLKGNKYTINVECKEYILMDSYPGAISQVLINLIHNSIIHGFQSSGEGIITIDVELLAHDVIIRFYDDGAGIGQENITQIFNPFFTTKQDEGGSGLGLSIVKSLVTEVLQGEISCANDVDKKAYFKIKMPINVNTIN